MIKYFLTKRALKQYQRKMPSALKSNYGGPGESGYTEGQVRTTLNQLKLNPTYTSYALLMFCGEQALQNETSESFLEMTKLVGSTDSGGYGASEGYGSHYDASDSFDGGGFDGGGGGDG